MEKKLCMFVWNHFTNDARVLRECTALSENGYQVDLICIHDPNEKNLPRFEQRNPRFAIYRVRRYPKLLQLLQKIYRKSRQNKIYGAGMLVIWGGGMAVSPLLTALLTALGIVVLKTKLKTIWVRGSIITRMIARGWQKPYELYHSNDLNTLPQGYICSKLRLSRKKLIYDSHEVQTSRTGYDSPYHGWLEKYLITKIDTMIVENHTRAKYNEKLYGFYPNVVHNYPFKQTEKNPKKVLLHEMLDLPSNEKILLYQGGIQAGRGLENLIQAVPFFQQGTLVLIGDGRIKPDLEKMVNERQLQGRVKFLPKVPVEELPSYTQNAYLGFQVLQNINFNHYSASSNKLFEYMMSGVPVIGCKFPEIKRVIEKEMIGITVDSHDYKEIEEAVNQLLVDGQKRKLMSKNCLRAREYYNWEMEKTNFLDVYQKLAAERKGEPSWTSI